MELIRISDSKLKVMLTPADVERFHLDPVSDSSEDLHRSFQLLLCEIKKESGFNACEKELSIQYFPSREGGCEMFISSLREKESQKVQEQKPVPLEKAGFRKEYAFRFCEMDFLLAACKRLFQIGYAGESAAFSDEEKHCFLFLGVVSPHPFEMPEELLFLTEYGRQESVTDTKLYLSEHGQELCAKDAVSLLAEYI